MKTRVFLYLIAFLLFVPPVYAGDGIPDNCEYGSTPGQLAIFPRYEFHNQRIVLVSWTSGEIVRELETSLNAEAVRFREWTADCRYLIAFVTSSASTDVLVWDTLDGNRISTVVTNRRNPPTIHLYPDTHLLVETPAGAILIHLMTRTQVTLSASWDEIPNRNFLSRPTIEPEQNWIRVVLLNQERAAYDLTTGLPVPDFFARAASANPVLTTVPRCSAPSYNRTANPSHRAGLYVRVEEERVLLYADGNLLRSLRDHLNGRSLTRLAFSEDCRYFAGAVLRYSENVYDTVIWDTSNNRELIFPDAQRIPHPVQFVRNDRVLIQTRHGAYLWNLDTDERTLLTDGLKVESSYRSESISNFHWFEVVENQLWAVTILSPNAITIYDLNSGTPVAHYDSGTSDRMHPALVTRLHSGWVAVESRPILQGAQRRGVYYIGLWNQLTGVHFYLTSGGSFYPSQLRILSADQRYLLTAADIWRADGLLLIWDLTALHPDGMPNYQTTVPFLQTTTWNRPAVFADGILTVGERSYDIFSGEMLHLAADVPGSLPEGQQLAPECSRSDISIVTYNNQIWVRDTNTGERLANLGAANGRVQFIGCYIILLGRHSSLLRIWDAQTLQPISVPVRASTLYAVAPDHATLLVYYPYPTWGFYLWHLPSNQFTRLSADIPFFSVGYAIWDYSRGQILVADNTGLLVRAFDLQTGMMRAFYEGNSTWNNYRGRGRFTPRLIDNRWLSISGILVTTIYDLNTGANFAFRRDEIRGDLYLSPHATYALVASDELHVWDLNALPRNLYANFTIPVQAVDVQFNDAYTVTISTSAGEILLWNLQSRQQQ